PPPPPPPPCPSAGRPPPARPPPPCQPASTRSRRGSGRPSSPPRKSANPRVLDSAPAGDGPAPPAPEAPARPAWLRRRGWQDRSAAPDSSRTLALGGAGRRLRGAGVHDRPALRDPRQGGVREGVGSAALVGQPHAGQLHLH